MRILRSRLGWIIRDIPRKFEAQPALEDAFALPLGRAAQTRSQQQRQRGWKLHSFHAPEVECIGKGKAAAPYEFGVKPSIVNNCCAPGGLFVLHASALPDSPYDGHTLRDVIDRTETFTGCSIERAYVDKGYRGHDAQNPRRVFISGQKRGVAVSSVSSNESCGAPFCHRAHHRRPQDRRSSRPLLPKRSRRRCRKRHPVSRRPQLPPHPRLAQRILGPVHAAAMANARLSNPPQSGFLTDDFVKSSRWVATWIWRGASARRRARSEVRSI